MSRTRKTVFICAVIVMVAALAFIAVYIIRQHDAGEVYDDLQDKISSPTSEPTKPSEPATEPTETQAATEPATEPETEPTEPPYVSPLDFDEIRKPNEHIYAWMEIQDTDIRYPVVQHPTDDTYYLNHTVEGKNRLPGSIYTEKWNSQDFSDFLTVVYGHNMKNGTMFGSLRKFRTKSYMQEHRTISFYTPEGEYHYKIFAAVTYSNAYLPSAFDYSTEAGRQGFIDSIVNVRDLSSYVDQDISVTPEDRLVVLSTCVGNDAYRLLVVGVLDRESSTK